MSSNFCEYCGEPGANYADAGARQCQDCGQYIGGRPGQDQIWTPVEKVVGGALLLASVGLVFFLWAWLVFGH